MPDELSTPSLEVYEDSAGGENVERVTITGDEVDVVLTYDGETAPPFGGDSEGRWFSGVENYLFDANRGGMSFAVDDEATGAAFTLPVVAGSVGAGDAVAAPLSFNFSFTTVDPPFAGTLQGINPCFCAGTLIDTPRGPVAVEALRPDDLVDTTDGSAAVTWLGHRRATDARVIRLRPGALGVASPRRDLFVSDDHGLLVDGVLVPAGLLVDGAAITAERRANVVFFHVELERHAILAAEGAPAESYLDTGNRAHFGNCPLGYDPATPGPASCAETVVAGPRLAAARHALTRLLAPSPA